MDVGDRLVHDEKAAFKIFCKQVIGHLVDHRPQQAPLGGRLEVRTLEVPKFGLDPFDGRHKPVDLRLPGFGMMVELMRSRFWHLISSLPSSASPLEDAVLLHKNCDRNKALNPSL